MKQSKSHRTVAQDPRIAGAIAADKRAAGFINVVVKTRGSDSKRGSRVWFDISWDDPR